MRGNEFLKHPFSPGHYVKFLIPMRGNESLRCLMVNMETVRFLIPMRGNEILQPGSLSDRQN